MCGNLFYYQEARDLSTIVLQNCSPGWAARPRYLHGGVAFFLLLCVGLACSPPAAAQQHLLFDHLTVKQGLSQGDVLCIFQDSRGFMWFGTQDGLNRYDGYEFRVYKNDPQNPSTISENFVILIAEDTSGTIWIGTRANGSVLNKFDRLSETFTHVPRDSVNLGAMRVSESRPGYIDPSGVRWSPTQAQGLDRYDPRTGKTTRFVHDPKNPGSLSDNKVYSVTGDRTGTIWVGTHGGLDRLDEKTGTFIHYRHNERDPKSLSDNFVWPLLEDHNGVLWVGTFQGGLNRFDRATGTFTHYRQNDLDPRGIGGDCIYALYEDASGMIWAGTGNHGVDRFNPDLSNFELCVHDASNASGLVDNDILSIYVDRSSLVWIGTESGLNCWDRKKGTFRLYKHDPKDPHTIGDVSVQAVLEDHLGTFWIGTVSNGLDRFDKTSNTFIHFTNTPGDTTSLSDNRVYALCEDHLGYIWVGTYAGGLCRFDRKSGSFRVFQHHDSLPGSLGGSGVWALLEDRGGQLWVGTYGGGLDQFNRETGTFAHFSHNEKNPNSLSDNIILTLFEDRKGTLWVGTTNGLNRFDRQSGTFRIYTQKDGLPNTTIFGILEDRRGYLWISTNKGISRFDPSKDQFHNFDYSDGLQGNEFNQAAYAQDPATGEIFFGGPNGLSLFQPERIKFNTFVPPVVFTSFTRYNMDDKKGEPIRDIGTDAKRAITISYKDNVVNFEFSALSYFNSFKNQYAYRLRGYNEGWIQLGPERRATFTNLSGGDYVLEVKGANNDGLWNEAGAMLNITVNPPWWKTRWAYGSYFILFVAFLYGIRTFEINRREQKAMVRESELRAKAAEAEKRALEAENERKTKELEDARKLQLSMLPREVPQVPGYAIAVFMKTATEVGGDYYDFTLSPERELNVAFGDATGHGMQAGTIVTLMKGLFISESSQFEIPTFFNRCSRAIKEIRLARLFMALTLARFRGNSLSMSSAGMPPAYLFRHSDGCVEEILQKGVPLGSMKNFPYALYETELEEGDTVLFMTDGLPEQKNAASEMFDYARILDCFRKVARKNPADIISELMREGEQWMNGAVQDDDITFLVVKKT